MIPVAVVRIDNNHRTVGGASAQRCAARIKHAVPRGFKFLVKLLLIVISVVAHEEVPGEALVFRCARVEGRYLIVGEVVVATRLEQQHLEAGQCQIGGQRAAAGPGSDHDIIEAIVVGCRGAMHRRSRQGLVARAEQRCAPARERTRCREARTEEPQEPAPRLVGGG